MINMVFDMLILVGSDPLRDALCSGLSLRKNWNINRVISTWGSHFIRARMITEELRKAKPPVPWIISLSRTEFERHVEVGSCADLSEDLRPTN